MIQATAVLKNVCSKYPYDSSTGEACLRTEADEICNELVRSLQARVRASGAEILSIALNEISYAPEAASFMLKKQEAQAMIEGRETIVRGAVDIALEACDELQHLGHPLNPREKSRIVGNLLTLLCSDEGIVPVLPMSMGE